MLWIKDSDGFPDKTLYEDISMRVKKWRNHYNDEIRLPFSAYIWWCRWHSDFLISAIECLSYSALLLRFIRHVHEYFQILRSVWANLVRMKAIVTIWVAHMTVPVLLATLASTVNQVLILLWCIFLMFQKHITPWT